MKRIIVSSTNINNFSLYIDGERNYDDVHYFVVKDKNGKYFEMMDVIDISNYLGYHAELMSDSELWVAAPKSARKEITSILLDFE